MIGRLESLVRRIRRLASRSEWVVRLLRLSRSAGTETKPGLVMIQIDGLSRTQLENALEQGRMPFLRSLIQGEGYHLHALYSGLPSNTPAFQGELFYGVKGVVPAFSFRDHKTGQIMRMADPQAAARLQQFLAEKGTGLLEGGSTYSDIYSGGAQESHFCPATFGWSDPLRVANPVVMGVFILWYGWSLVRTGALLVLEFALAVIDCIRGLIAGQDLWKELKFVPTRVAICILLREMVTIGTKIDTNRGLPVIHLNYLGYDEQAHRRGPSSAFAHWTLKGIDDAIKRVWRAAKRSPRRDYDVWIYSDHGQERTVPFPVENGRSVQEAVADVLGQLAYIQRPQNQEKRGIQFERAKWLGGGFFRWLLRNQGKPDGGSVPLSAVVTSMGPIGHVYLQQNIEPEERDRFARALVERAKIPLVLVPAEPNTVRAWTATGIFSLPADAGKILGMGHPFLEEVAQDLVSLCHHPDAGAFVISGWRLDDIPISFPSENGAHAGPGPEETRGFALVPADTPLPDEDRDHLRPLDLREGAQNLLSRFPRRVTHRPRRQSEGREALRIMTYNVHSCFGMDGKVSPGRIARVIALYHPDVVALQELDVGRSRTGEIDQAQAIAHNLEMDVHFHPSIQVEEERYGNAILSRHPMRLIRAGALPGLSNCPNLEPRGALWVSITVDGREIQMINTHLGLSYRERLIQAEALVGSEWVAHPDCREPVILCGDFNALPGSQAWRRLCDPLRDAQMTLNNHQPKSTWFGRYPVGRIDHVFVGQKVTVLGVKVPRMELTQMASDHLPLIVDVCIP